MMLLRTVELAFARFQRTRDPRALAIVFDRTAHELSRVARHLATDPAGADDLVQATFVTAIEAAATHDRGQPVLPWLLGILANHARAARRASRRALDPQRLRGDVVADVHRELEAGDVRSELAAAIARLPDVHRPVLRLWFEHGLDAKEIAAVLERPAGTVRAQLSRGMTALRRALPAGLAGSTATTIAAGQGLAAMRSRLLAMHGAPASGIASSFAIGGLLVLHHKLLSGAVVVALACLAWFAFPALAENPAAEAPLASDAAKVASSAGLPLPAPPAMPLDRTDAAVSTASPAPAAPAPPPTTPLATAASLSVRVRSGPAGAPVAGIGVAIHQQPQRGPAAGSFQATDANGIAHFAGVAPGTWFVDVDRAGQMLVAALAPGEAAERTIDLAGGVLVEGTVLDARAFPANDAAIVLHGSRLSSPRVATTDAHGRFRIEHLASGVELAARKAGHAPSLAHGVQAQPGSHVAVTLHLGDGGRTVRGRVLDANGEPAAGAAVALLPDAARHAAPWQRGVPQARALWLATDAAGNFATDEAAPLAYVVAAVFADDATPAAVAEADARTNDAWVELRAGAATAIEGAVRGAEGPPGGLQVIAFTERPTTTIGYLQNQLAFRPATAAPDGTFRIVGVMPGEVVVRAMQQTPTLQLQMLGERRFPLASGETQRCDFDAGTKNPLAIRVTAPVRLPVGLKAFVWRTDAANAAPDIVTLDDRGRAAFDGARPAPVRIVLWVARGLGGAVHLAHREVPVAAASVHFELRAEDLPATSLRGRIVDASAAVQSGVTVRAERTDAPPLVALVETTAGADGTFVLGPLPAGRYVLTSGSLTARIPLGTALLTAARDELLGDLVLPR